MQHSLAFVPISTLDLTTDKSNLLSTRFCTACPLVKVTLFNVTAFLNCDIFPLFNFQLFFVCKMFCTLLSLIIIWASGLCRIKIRKRQNTTQHRPPLLTSTLTLTCCCSLSSDLIASIKLRVNVCSSKYFCLWFSNSFSMNLTSSFWGGKLHTVLQAINCTASL